MKDMLNNGRRRSQGSRDARRSLIRCSSPPHSLSSHILVMVMGSRAIMVRIVIIRTLLTEELLEVVRVGEVEDVRVVVVLWVPPRDRNTVEETLPPPMARMMVNLLVAIMKERLKILMTIVGRLQRTIAVSLLVVMVTVGLMSLCPTLQLQVLLGMTRPVLLQQLDQSSLVMI